MTAPRIIRVGPRPIIVFSVMLILLLILPLLIGIRTHDWANAAKFATVFIGIVALMCLIAARINRALEETNRPQDSLMFTLVQNAP
jgi:hypothetical protein